MDNESPMSCVIKSKLTDISSSDDQVATFNELQQMFVKFLNIYQGNPFVVLNIMLEYVSNNPDCLQSCFVCGKSICGNTRIFTLFNQIPITCCSIKCIKALDSSMYQDN